MLKVSLKSFRNEDIAQLKVSMTVDSLRVTFDLGDRPFDVETHDDSGGNPLLPRYVEVTRNGVELLLLQIFRVDDVVIYSGTAQTHAPRAEGLLLERILLGEIVLEVGKEYDLAEMVKAEQEADVAA